MSVCQDLGGRTVSLWTCTSRHRTKVLPRQVPSNTGMWQTISSFLRKKPTEWTGFINRQASPIFSSAMTSTGPFNSAQSQTDFLAGSRNANVEARLTKARACMPTFMDHTIITTSIIAELNTTFRIQTFYSRKTWLIPFVTFVNWSWGRGCGRGLASAFMTECTLHVAHGPHRKPPLNPGIIHMNILTPSPLLLPIFF